MKRYWWLVYALIFSPLALSQQVMAQQLMPPLAQAESPIGYATVQEAFEALSADPDATQNEYDGWTIFQQKMDGKYVIWSFTPEDHPVHPSVVRREAVIFCRACEPYSTGWKKRSGMTTSLPTYFLEIKSA